MRVVLEYPFKDIVFYLFHCVRHLLSHLFILNIFIYTCFYICVRIIKFIDHFISDIDASDLGTPNSLDLSTFKVRYTKYPRIKTFLKTSNKINIYLHLLILSYINDKVKLLFSVCCQYSYNKEIANVFPKELYRNKRRIRPR
jgi:hypothetical protein